MNMHVLVTAASKHGGTHGIADAIGRALAKADLAVTVAPPDDVASLDEYDAVVLGSGIYAGRWMDPAKRFVDRHAAALADRPVWLFSSGPMGDPPKPEGDPADATAMIGRTLPRGHRVFAGRLVKRELGFAEKAIVAAVRAPEGDFRPWAEIEAWAAQIARELASQGRAAEARTS